MSRCRSVPSPVSFPGGALAAAGGGGADPTETLVTSTPHTVLATDDVLNSNVAGLMHYDLPPLASVPLGKVLEFKASVANGWVQLDPNGTENIEGTSGDFSISPPWGMRIAIKIIKGSAGWWVLSQFIGQPPSQVAIPLETPLPPAAWMLGTDPDWPETNVVALTADADNLAIPVALLPASANTGVGFELYTPGDGTYSLLFLRMMIKAVTPPGTPKVVKFGLQRRRIDNVGGPPAWTDYAIPDFTVPITAGYGKYQSFLPVSTVGLNAVNQTHQLQLYRNGLDVGDTLTGSAIVISNMSPRWS